MSRLQLYVAGSALLANVVLLRAYYERPNFYSAAVYISQSTGSLMFLINLALILTGIFGYGLQRLFYGPLRPIETEQLYDKAWFAVSETLLAMTIFRDDIGIWFFAMFLCLLGGKVWQWIAEGRVEFLEQQPPANPRLFHTRLMSSLILSVGFDVFMTQYCIDSIKQDVRPGSMVMFGFEYVLLAIASVSTLLRYVLSLVEIMMIRSQEKARVEARRILREQAREQAASGEAGAAETATEEEDDDDDGEVPGWEEKGRWVFAVDLLTDFIKSVVYVGFFFILVAFYGMPIHIMRDLFLTIRSFIKRVNDFIRYRHATQDMNARYPDATAEELERENICIVCREEMRLWVPSGGEGAQPGRRNDERQRPKKLPCGHILHFSCLRSWLERQQVCPTCRRSVLAEVGGAQNNAQNNQANQGQQNPQNQPNLPGLRNFLAGNNVFQANGGNQQPAQAGQQGQPPGAGGENRPAGNVRVFNLGPIRIALGNLRLPANQPNNANGGNNNAAVANLAQQLLDRNQNPGQVQVQQMPLANPNQNQNQPQPQIGAQPAQAGHLPLLNQGGASITLPGGGAFIPARIVNDAQTLQMLGLRPNPTPATHGDVQTDILRLQQNIIASVRQLHAQHGQLEYIHALLAELNRLQQASGVTAITGQELPGIAPLSGVAPVVPHGYLANGPVLRAGDADLPQGLVLPEGWTLRRMAPMPAADQAQPASSAVPSPLSTTGGTANTTGSAPSVLTTPAAVPTPAQPPVPFAESASSSAPRSETSPSDGPATKAAEPSSLESSWSFGNIPGSSEGEGSSSAVAGPSSEASTITRRTATVEDAEDNGQ